MSHAKSVVVLSTCAIFVACLSSPAQDVIFPGSTPQGDILRGEGVFLRGKGLYDYYSAKGRRIDAGTMIMIQKWNAEVYAGYMRERASHIQSKKNVRNETEAAARKRMAEKEIRLRANPDDFDIVSGDALNALLIDLSSPAITQSAWQEKRVTLPEGIEIRSLFFRFVPRLGARNAGTLSKNLIALGRLDPSRGWPSYIPQDKVGAECRAYEAAHKELLARCVMDKQLKFETLEKVDKALLALQNKVNVAVPSERRFRETALRYVTDMKDATKIFDAETVDFVKEMIQDTQEYTPQTVAELLAFLRKYRLLFASAEGRPGDGDMYRVLAGLMREQKEGLGLPVLPPEMAAVMELPVAPPPEEARFQGRWVLLRTMREGKITPASAEPAKVLLQIFDGNQFVVRNAQMVFNSGTWKLDIAKSPKVIDRDGVTAKKQFITLRGIYDWVDGDLRICSSPTRRPGEFKAPPGTDNVIQVWRRQP
jgi:uncharacterized protein (TIGR03067 family)